MLRSLRVAIIAAAALVPTLWASTSHAKLALCGSVTSVGDSIRYCSNHPLTINNKIATNKNITRAVIFIHGVERDAIDYYNRILSDAQDEGVDDTTAILTPQFITQGDATDNNLSADYAYWTSEGWKHGEASLNGHQYSSFSYVDGLINYADVVYPNLEHVAVVGWSAGAQFVHAYAAMTQMPVAGGFLDRDHVTMSFGVGSPSFYLWPDADRPAPNPAATGYNDYPRGLVNAENNAYAQLFHLTESEIIGNYLSRHIYYLVGQSDTKRGVNFDDSPASDTQGATRLARARNYRKYLEAYCQDYANLVTALGGHFDCATQPGLVRPLQELPGVPHSSSAAFQTAQGRNVLFYWN